jgi:hypothetical protein|uniref:Uncharacterized protein n=1 Tax=Myoviridae sp. ctshb19 TaxID=2825194 RepID=A0A8S5UH75_9CAUD|nr:MAG TPA: hypothetical protein [Myoviridae sp. ctshb19]
MEVWLALAAEDLSARISDGVRQVLKRSYTSLFANVFVQVYDIPDRHKSEIKQVKEMDADYTPVLVSVEDQKHKRVTFVFAVPVVGNVMHVPYPPLGYVIFDNKVQEFSLEARVIKVRGIDYAIAATVARRAPNFIEFGK